MKENLTLIIPYIDTFIIIYVSVLVSIFLDLWSGVRKAKQRKEYRSSYGLRRTINKICSYFNMLFAVGIIDVLQMTAISQMDINLPIIPFFSFLGGIFAVFIEIKSIYENNDIKTKKRLRNSQKDITKIVIDVLETRKKIKKINDDSNN